MKFVTLPRPSKLRIPLVLLTLVLPSLWPMPTSASGPQETYVVPRSSVGRAESAVSGVFSPIRGVVISDNSYDLRSGRTAAEVRRAVAEGITYFRTGLAWWNIEAERDSFDFALTDSLVHAVIDNGGTLLPILGYGTPWAAEHPDGTDCHDTYNADRAIADQYLPDWADYVDSVVTRYGDVVDYYEIWNEEDLWRFYDDDVPSFLRLLAAADSVISLRDPTAKTVLGGLAFPEYQGATWFAKLLQLGGSQHFDVLGVHGYAAEQHRVLNQVEEAYSTAGFTVPDDIPEIWVTETGRTSGPATAAIDYVASNATQLDYVHRTLSRWRDDKVKAVFWYNGWDRATTDAGYSALDGGAVFGLVDSVGVPKPAFYDWAHWEDPVDALTDQVSYRMRSSSYETGDHAGLYPAEWGWMDPSGAVVGSAAFAPVAYISTLSGLSAFRVIDPAIGAQLGFDVEDSWYYGPGRDVVVEVTVFDSLVTEIQVRYDGLDTNCGTDEYWLHRSPVLDCEKYDEDIADSTSYIRRVGACTDKISETFVTQGDRQLKTYQFLLHSPYFMNSRAKGTDFSIQVPWEYSPGNKIFLAAVTVRRLPPEPSDLQLSFSNSSIDTALSVNALVPFNWYVLNNTSIDYPIGAWEGSVVLPPEVTVISRELLPGNVDYGSGLDNFVVGLSNCQSSNSFIPLVTYTGILFSSLPDLEIELAPPTPSSLEAVGLPAGPAWASCDGELIPYSDLWQTSKIVINPTGSLLDTEPPLASAATLGFSYPGSWFIDVAFNEPLEPDSAVPSHFTVESADTTIAVSSVQFPYPNSSSRIRIVLDVPVQDPYPISPFSSWISVSILSVEDLAGNVVSTAQDVLISDPYASCAAVQHPQIRISEFMASPSDEPQALEEWIEISRAGTLPVDLSGSTLRIGSSYECLLAPDYPLILTDVPFVIARNQDAVGAQGIPVALECPWPALDEQSGSIELILPGGCSAAIEWDSSWPITASHSMELNNGGDPNDISSWTVAQEWEEYSPGSYGSPAQYTPIATSTVPIVGPGKARILGVRTPFRDKTAVRLLLPSSQHVDLEVYDAKGRKVHRIFSGIATQGSPSFSWNGKDDRGMPVSMGVYFLRFAVDGRTVDTRKIAVIR